MAIRTRKEKKIKRVMLKVMKTMRTSTGGWMLIYYIAVQFPTPAYHKRINNVAKRWQNT